MKRTHFALIAVVLEACGGLVARAIDDAPSTSMDAAADATVASNDASLISPKDATHDADRPDVRKSSDAGALDVVEASGPLQCLPFLCAQFPRFSSADTSGSHGPIDVAVHLDCPSLDGGIGSTIDAGVPTCAALVGYLSWLPLDAGVLPGHVELRVFLVPARVSLTGAGTAQLWWAASVGAGSCDSGVSNVLQVYPTITMNVSLGDAGADGGLFRPGCDDLTTSAVSVQIDRNMVNVCGDCPAFSNGACDAIKEDVAALVIQSVESAVAENIARTVNERRCMR